MRIFSLIITLIIGQICTAQVFVVEDKELASLLEVVKMLRNPTEENFNKAKQLLSTDNKWTPMSETGKLQVSECKPVDKTPGFKLNRILTSVARGRKYVSTKGEMLNGEDERYLYSLYERSLKEKSKATYTLRKRHGRQTFIVVPYVTQKEGLSIMVNGKKMSSIKENEDGTLIFNLYVTKPEISLTVTNRSANPLSFVIINYNSRTK